MQGATPKTFVLAALLRASVFLTLLFAACIGLIRAQPYDDSHLRAFLAPPADCAMPCFMGIRPGATTMNEARHILETHEWVGQVHEGIFTEGSTASGWIYWLWSGQQPEFLQTDEGPGDFIRIEHGIVKSVSVYTSIPLGTVWLRYGQPTHGTVDVVTITAGNRYEVRMLSLSAYSDLGLEVTSYPPCPASRQAFWDTPVWLTYTSQPQAEPMAMDRFSDLLAYHNQLCRG